MHVKHKIQELRRGELGHIYRNAGSGAVEV